MMDRRKVKPWTGKSTPETGYNPLGHLLWATTRRSANVALWGMFVAAWNPDSREHAGKLALNAANGVSDLVTQLELLAEDAGETVKEIDAVVADTQHKVTDGDRFRKRVRRREEGLETAFIGRFFAFRNARKPAKVHNAEGVLVDSELSVIDWIREHVMEPQGLPEEMLEMRGTLTDFAVGMAWQESGFRHDAFNDEHGAKGLFQFIPDTWNRITQNWPFANALPDIGSTDHQVYALRKLFTENYESLTNHELAAPALQNISEKYFGNDKARFKNEFMAPLLVYAHYCSPDAVAEAVAHFNSHYPGPEVLRSEGLSEPLETFDLASIFANHIAHESRRPTVRRIKEFRNIGNFGPKTRNYFELIAVRAFFAKSHMPDVTRSDTLPPLEHGREKEILPIPTERPNPQFSEDPASEKAAP